MLTQRVFLKFSELQLCEDGVSTISRHRGAVDAAVRESTRLVTPSLDAGTRRTAKVRMGNPLEAMEALEGAHDVNGVVLTVDLYQKTRNDLVRDCSPGFEARLVEQRQGADLCYAVHADGLVLLATPSGREAASDLILRLLQRGATCVAKEDYVILKKKTLSKDEKKDLKSLLDVCTAFGVSFADYNSKAVVNAGGTTFDHARLEALLGLTIGDVSVQVLSGKQAIVFPSSPEEGLFETLPLGAQIVSALASGRRGDRIELWRSDDQALGKHELQVQVAQPRYMCSPWSDRRGECLMPHHTTVRTSLNLVNDQQLGVAASMLDLSGGGVRAEACTLLPSLEWLLKALTVFGVSLNPVPHGILDDHSVAACCRLCDAWSVIGESLRPQPDLVNRLDQIFGVESSEDRARRLADGEAALNVAAAPFPAPCPAPSLGKKVYAKPLVKKDRWSSEDCARNQRTDASCRRRLSGSIKTCEHREQKGPYKYRKPGADSA